MPWLAVIAVLTTVVSFYYYLGVVRAIVTVRYTKGE